MEEAIKLPYASPVEALLLSRRNNSGQRMRVPGAVGSLLSEMIRSEVRLAAASSEVISEITDIVADFQLWWPLSGTIHFMGVGLTPVRSLASKLVPIIGDLTCWRR